MYTYKIYTSFIANLTSIITSILTGYNAAQNIAPEKKQTNIGVTKDATKQVLEAKRSNTDIAKPTVSTNSAAKKVQVETKSITNIAASTNSKSGIYEVLNNAKTFALGLAVGTVAIITYQKKKGILDIEEVVDYTKSDDIISPQLDDERMSVSYLESLNMASYISSEEPGQSDVDGQNE